jgi:hypothetical protein
VFPRAPVAGREPDRASANASRSPEPAPDADRTRPDRNPFPTEPRQIYEIRGRTVRARESEVGAMIELGKFRAIAQEDLVEFFYQGDKDRFRPDIENLLGQGLLQLKVIPHEDQGSRTLLTLTKLGQRFLTEIQATRNDQILYYGFTKPREAHHDADLYRLYQRAAAKIERKGGKNLRVVLDYEMKKRVYHDLAKLGDTRNSPARKREIAELHHLHMVRGKIPVPDVRIEYENRDGEKSRIDLELATGHYRGRNLADKVRAGFAIYALGEEASKLRKVLEQRELTAEILSL